MPWVKLDDGYFRNPKTRAAGPDGQCLHLASSCWSAANGTNGKIPKSDVDLLVAEAQTKKATVTKLVRLNLWHDEGDHYLIHDWEQYIKSREETEKERARWRSYKRGSSESSTAESNGGSTVESLADSALSRPDQTSTGLNHQPRTQGAAADRAAEVMTSLVRAERSTAGQVRNGAAWDRKVSERIASEHGERIAQLVNSYPDAPADAIAGHLRGESNSLQYYTRGTPA